MRRLVSVLTAITLTLASLSLSAQNKKISGTVVAADDGSPIAGAFVQVISDLQSKAGAFTEADGSFSIDNAPYDAKYLSVSFYGMETEQIEIKPDMRIALRTETRLIEESMVVAYETVKKSSYSGSAAMVRGEQLGGIPSSSFENALTGRVAGVSVTSSSGQAGSVASIRIRGNGSMNASNEPLYVVDGVPVISGDIGQMSGLLYTSNNVMSTINNDDIESISILKDAAASSLYGSRAANGVVIITTKRGKMGRPVVNLKASIGITPEWATDNYEAASVQENINMLYEVFYDYCLNSSSPKKLSGISYPNTPEGANGYALKQLNNRFNKHGYEFSTDGIGRYDNVIIGEYDNSGRGLDNYFDWDKAYFRTAAYQNYDISVSGANNNSSYYTSLSYTGEEGRLFMNNFERFSGRVNLTQKISKYLETETNVSVSRSSKSGINDTRNTGNNFFMQTRNLLWGFYWPTKYSDGSDWTDRYGSYARNGIWMDKQWDNESINTRISAIEGITLHLFDGLDARTKLSYDNTSVRDHLYFSELHPSASSDNGKILENRTTYETIITSSTLNYNKTFAQLHNISLLAGFETEWSNMDYVRAEGTNLASTALQAVSTAGTMSAKGFSSGSSLVSMLSKADYNYASKYYLSASFRRDGSSKLSKSVRWGNFWSVAGSWKISSEDFMKGIDWLNELKLRASYGTNGTTPSSNYAHMNLMGYTDKYLGQPGGTISTGGNENLRWETSYNSNVGLDFTVLGNRLSGSVEYFNRDSKDLLQDVPVSGTTGFTTTLMNIGEINNHGLELSLDGTLVAKRNFRWSAGANVSFIKSTVTSLYDEADVLWYDPTGSDNRCDFIYRQGQSTLAFYGIEWAGVNKENGKSVYYVNSENDNDLSGTEGYFEYNNRLATYDYNKACKTIIGDANPLASGGFHTELRIGRFDIGANFSYKIGGNLYDAAEKDVCDDGYYWERIRSKYYYDNRWTEDNPNGTQPAISGFDLEDSIQISTRHIYDASFLRLKTLSIGFSIPEKLLHKINMTSARLFFNGSNLWTLSSYKLADPEVNAYGTRGWETPYGKTFTFGIDLKF